MNELILIVIMLTTIVYMAEPYWRKQAIETTHWKDQRLTDLIEKRDSILAQIKEIEFDHETGKITADDFAEINARYRSEAIDILRRIDVLRGNNVGSRQGRHASSKAKHQRRKETGVCGTCGEPAGPADRFCSGCGSPLTR